MVGVCVVLLLFILFIENLYSLHYNLLWNIPSATCLCWRPGEERGGGGYFILCDRSMWEGGGGSVEQGREHLILNWVKTWVPQPPACAWLIPCVLWFECLCPPQEWISAFLKRLQGVPCPFHDVRTHRRQHPWGNGSSPGNTSTGALISSFPTSRTMWE